MSNRNFSERIAIRLTPKQRKWLRDYATERGFSEADALREVLDSQIGESPKEMASLRAELDRYDKALTAMTDALSQTQQMVTASVTAGTAVAKGFLDTSGQDRLRAVGE